MEGGRKGWEQMGDESSGRGEKGREKWRWGVGRGRERSMKAEGRGGRSGEASRGQGWLGRLTGAPTSPGVKAMVRGASLGSRCHWRGQRVPFQDLPPCTPGTGFQDLDSLGPHCHIPGPRPRGVWGACPYPGLPQISGLHVSH